MAARDTDIVAEHDTRIALLEQSENRTRCDFDAFRQDMKEVCQGIRSDIKEGFQVVNTSINKVKEEYSEEIEGLRNKELKDLHETIASLSPQVADTGFKTKITWGVLGTLALVALGILTKLFFGV